MTEEFDLEALAGAAGIGAVAGLRSLTAPALVSQAARTGSIDLADGPCAFLGAQQTADVVTGLALAELFVDKFPGTPDRIQPFPLAARAVSGALVGGAVCSARGEEPGPGAVVGALAAVGAAFLGYGIRKRYPGFFTALLEDAAAVAIAVFVLRNEAGKRKVKA